MMANQRGQADRQRKDEVVGGCDAELSSSDRDRVKRYARVMMGPSRVEMRDVVEAETAVGLSQVDTNA